MTSNAHNQDPNRAPIDRAIEHLSALTAPLITPGHPDYDDARQVFYHGYDRRPAVVTRPTNTREVAAVVDAARDLGLPLAVRSGGHSVLGQGVVDDGIVLDLSLMRSIDIDPHLRVAWADTGLTAGEYTRAVGEHGLATGFGDTGSVGIGGITLGGGVGFLHRKYGLTIDQLLAAEIVTADGQILHTDSVSEPDLFWAIRGGGGNFGVVTRFKFALHELRDVVGGMIAFPASPEVIEAVLAEAHSASDDLAGMINVMPAPPMPMIDAEHHGKLIVGAFMVHAGNVADGHAAFDRLRSIAEPVVDMIQVTPYPGIYEGPEPPHPAFAATRSLFSDGVSRAELGEILEELERSTAQMRAAQFRVLGGAVARVPNEATAFAHRNRKMAVVIAAAYESEDDFAEHDGWVDRVAGILRRGDDGAYVNFLADQGQEGVRAAYPGSTFDRLRAVKAKYDPDNLFRHNQNIPPA